MVALVPQKAMVRDPGETALLCKGVLGSLDMTSPIQRGLMLLAFLAQRP
jgi:hypothetical protein